MWANRLASAGIVAAIWLSARMLWPDPLLHEQQLFLCITTLGYGHLIGAWWFGRRRAKRSAEEPRLERAARAAFVATGAGVGFCLYVLLLQQSVLFALPFAAAFLWHTVENDLALGAQARRGGRLRPISTSPRSHAWMLLAGPAIVLLLASAPELSAHTGRQPLSWKVRTLELYGLPALYHVVSWLLLSIGRLHAQHRRGETREASSRAMQLALIHAFPLLVWALVSSLDAAAVKTLARGFYGMDVYLYWSFLHVLHTAMARSSRAPARDRGAARRSPLTRSAAIQPGEST